MSRFLYPIRKLEIMPWIKYWLINKTAGTLSEVLENLTSPITLQNSLKRKFKIFEVGGNSVQDGTPSPTNPIPIQNVGDNVNIYHIEDQETFTINGIEWSVNNNIIHARGTATTDSSTRARIPFDMTGKVGSFSFKAKEGTYVYCRVEKNGSTTYPTSPITLDGTETLVQIYPQISRGVTVDIDISIKVEEGSTPTSYSPYNCGSVDVKVESKNYLQFNPRIGLIINEDGSATLTTEASPRNASYKSLTGLIPAGTYTFHNISGLEAYVIFASGDYSHLVLVGGSYTFQYDGISYLAIIYANQSTNTVKTYKAQLEQGSTATDYVKHEEQTVTFPTAEGQVLHLGDTLEDDGIHQRKITKVLDGTENYTMSAVDNLNRFALYLINSVSSNTRISVISSHFRYASSGNAEGIIFLNHQSVYMYPATNIASVADFKAWLAQQYANGTPVTVEYELAEPIIVPYTEAQQQVYDEIKALYSYKGTTYISSDNEPSPIFKIQYVKEE